MDIEEKTILGEHSPIPARLLQPWIEDNSVFIQGLAERRRCLESATELRKSLAIRQASSCDPVLLAAVDAAVIDVPIGDMVSVLIQVVHVADSGQTTFGHPIRATGVNGYDISLARMPLRVAAECQMLTASQSPTIADTSYWSVLMEVNQTITRYENGGANNVYLSQAFHELIRAGRFLDMLRNEQVIAMSKTNQSCKYAQQFASDREMLGKALHPGEFLVPQGLASITTGNFGIEKRGFTDSERDEVHNIYTQQLGVTFYKPHAWSRAYRIEGRLRLLNDDAWLMPLLSAIHHHTKTRTAEPWPQFMTDWTSKRIQSLATLYGDLNFHRTPFYDPARTLG